MQFPISISLFLVPQSKLHGAEPSISFLSLVPLASSTRPETVVVLLKLETECASVRYGNKRYVGVHTNQMLESIR